MRYSVSVITENVYAQYRSDPSLLALHAKVPFVVLSGDSHNAWASDLQDISGNQVGVEFATSSVSSSGFESFLPNEAPDALAARLVQFIEPLRFANTEHRGYMILSVSNDEVQAQWHFINTVKSLNYEVVTTKNKRLSVFAGIANRKIVETT